MEQINQIETREKRAIFREEEKTRKVEESQERADKATKKEERTLRKAKAMRREDEGSDDSKADYEEYCDPREEDLEEEVSFVAPSIQLKKRSAGSRKDRKGGALRSRRASKTHKSNLESKGSRSLGSKHSRRHKMTNSREVRKTHRSPLLKLELPTFKGGKKADLDVHIQVSEK